MSNSTHFVPLDVILPDTISQADHCVAKLQQLLAAEQFLDKVHVKTKEDQTGICVHYNPDIVTLDTIKAMIKITGASVADRYQHVTLTISGMDCADCTQIIEHTLTHLPGVMAAKVGYASQQLRLEFDRDKIKLSNIIRHLGRFGYVASLKEKPPTLWQRHGEITLSLTAGVLLLFGWLLQETSLTASLSLLIFSYICGGFLSFRDSIQTLLQRRLDIELLMVLAALGAAFLGEWVDGSLLLFLFSLGHALEHKAMHHAKDAVQALGKLAPDTATVLDNNQQVQIAVEDIALNDIVIIKAGQRFPIDGIVTKGFSTVDQAPITGESLPVDKNIDDQVFAGTINGEGTLHIKANARFADTTLQRMVKLVLEADTQKSPTQQYTDKFVHIFVPSILIGVLLLIFIPLTFGVVWHDAFYRAISVLVAASPCALAIATPASVLSGVARAAQRGVLIKGGMHLENLGSIRAIAFDKTGTLTNGKPQVQTVVAIDGTEEEVLQIAASVEQYSSHPLAEAVLLAARNKNLTLSTVKDVQTHIGKGISGNLTNHSAFVGNTKLFASIPTNIQEASNDLLSVGQTIMLVKLGERWLGIIGLVDTIRPETAKTLEKLRNQGIEHTIMLTGDNTIVAQRIAKQINISEIKADLLPEQKLEAITALEKQYQHIAMVGDGINDAPAMARATVGIAMGGAGADVALEAADVALMADDLSQLPFAMRLSRQSLRVIKQNLIISLGMVFILLILTVTGLSGIGPAIIAHEGSTLVVVLNALRLLAFK